jgi:hypothetical protein
MKNKFSFAMTLAVIMSMLFNSLALADQITPDADTLVANNQITKNLGTVAPGAVINTPVSFILECNGNKHVDNGQTVNLTFTLVGSTVPAGGSLNATNASIGPIPLSWPDDGNTCPSPAPTPISDNGDSTAAITAPSAPGTYNYVVAFSRNVSAPDISGGNTTVTFTLTVSAPSDTTAPTLHLPANITTEATGPSGAVVTFSATADDTSPAHPAVTCTPASGSTFPLGATTVNCSATDAASNTANGSFTVTVQDTTNPSIADNANLLLEATSPSGAVATFSNPSASDTVDSSVAVGCVPPSGSTFGLGTSSVICTATDDSGNSSNSSFDVTVQDTTAPSLSLPSDITAEATGSTGAAVSYVASATDLVDGSVAANCTPASGSTFALGSTPVSCSASDAAGNSASGGFNVIIQDTSAPVLALPADMTAEATGPSGAAVSYSASASDLVDGPVTPSCAPASGATFPLGTTPVGCSATDAHSNTATGGFNVTVVDTTAPVIAAHSNVTEEATSALGAIVSYTSPATSDAVDGAGTATCLPASGSQFALGNTTVTCNASDAAGNVSTPITFEVHVVDTTAPVIAAHGDETAEATSALGAIVNYTSPVTSDAVDGAGVASCAPASGSQFALGNTTVTCDASDAAGNTATSTTFVVHVVDTTAPTITLASRLPAANSFGWNNSAVTVTWSCTDLVGVLSASVSQTVSAEGAGQSATGTCEDTSGNTADDTVSGINIDLTAPSVALVGGPANGGSYYFGSVPVAPTCSASDALSGLNGACSVSGYSNAIGSHTVTASATDKAGNSASASATYTVLAWTINGFYQPVDMGKLNISKNGSTVPLKFEVFAGSTELTNISIVSTFVQKLTCGTGVAMDDIESYATGGTSLRYDTTGGQFIFNWQTPKIAGNCYRVTLTTSDGTSISADFKLK